MSNKIPAFFFIGIALIIIAIWGLGQLRDNLAFQERERYETMCNIGKIKATVDLIKGVDSLRDSQALCVNSNCTKYFQDKIDYKQGLIDTMNERLDCKNYYDYFTQSKEKTK